MRTTMRAALAALLALYCQQAAYANTFQFSGDPPPTVTFATLPTCNASNMKGAERKVSDSTTTSAGATVAGGGANLVVVECNGTNWVVDIPGGGVGSGDIDTVWLCTSGDCSTLTAAAGDSLNATSADSSIPSTGSTSLPGTCTEGQLHRDTDSGGTETYVCTATNTWTKVLAAADLDTIAKLDAIVADANVIDATEIDQASEILAPWTGTKTASTFPDGGGGMRPIGAALEAANCAAVTTPASGYSQIFRNTTDGFDYIKDDGGNCEPIATFVDGSLPSNLAMLRFKGSQIQEVPGSSCADTGVCTGAGFVATGGNPWSVTAHVNDGAVGTAKNCARFDTPGSFDHDAGSAAELLSAMPVNQANDLSFRFLTVTLNSWQTDANFVADEEVSFVIRTCTLDATPTAGDCTTRDKIVFEGDSSALGSYGTSRTNIACATRPCQATIPLDGNGVSPQGTVAFAAGTVDYWVICWENDDAEWTADLTSAPGTFDATFKVDLVD